MLLQRRLLQTVWQAIRLSGTAAMSLLCNLARYMRALTGANPAAPYEADRVMGIMSVQDSRCTLMRNLRHGIVS